LKQVVRSHNDAYRFVDKVCNDLGQTFERPQLIEMRLYKPPRSLPQNARLHCMIRALSDYTGHSESELKSWFKAEYGPTKRLQVGSQGQVIPLSTIDYNKKQMTELIDHVDRVCAENGVYVEDME